jgi:hypothetical protein
MILIDVLYIVIYLHKYNSRWYRNLLNTITIFQKPVGNFLDDVFNNLIIGKNFIQWIRTSTEVPVKAVTFQGDEITYAFSKL